MKLETGVRDPKEMQSRKLYEGSGVQGERSQEIKVFEKGHGQRNLGRAV